MTHIVLLRGLTRESRHWKDVPQRIVEQLPGARVTCLDFPGNGTKADESSPLRIGEYVAACRRQAERWKPAGPSHLVALSLGGMVAVDWAARFPDEVASCVLINTSVRPLAPLRWRLRPTAIGILLRAMAARDIEVRERNVLRVTSRRFKPGTPTGTSIVAEWAEIQRDAPVRRANALRQLIAAARFKCAIQPSVPTLLLASTRDQFVDVRCSRAVESRWGCPLHEHPTAGHDLPLDEPEWLVEHVVGWTQRHGPKCRA